MKHNPGHKEALKARLFAENAELGPDDLENVVGGVAPERTFKLEDWPDEHGGTGPLGW